MTFQTAEIERPLISASQLAASGHRVVFSKTGGEIVLETCGRRTALHKRGGIYVLRMWIPENPEQGFAGPETKTTRREVLTIIRAGAWTSPSRHVSYSSIRSSR